MLPSLQTLFFTYEIIEQALVDNNHNVIPHVIEWCLSLFEDMLNMWIGQCFGWVSFGNLDLGKVQSPGRQNL